MSAKLRIPDTHRFTHWLAHIVAFIALVLFTASLFLSDVSAQTAPLTTPDQSTIYYVDAAKTAGSNDGSSWTDAFTSLQSALDIAQAGDQIWVAEGVYTPSQRTEEDDPRSATFNLVDGVTIYGGFAGTPGQEEDLSLRDWQTYPTILSGDIDGNDLVDEQGVLTTTANLVGENAYHVLLAEGVGKTTILDGFFITAGAATGESREQNFGGGMYNVDSDPTLSNVTFTANSAHYGGGGMYNYDSNPTLNNVTFTANSTDHDGGGMYVDDDSSPFISNSIFWDNVKPLLYASHDSHITISDSLVQGGCPVNTNVTCAGAILDTDPRFVRPPNSGDGDWSTLEDNDYGDLRLQADSAAIDAGNNASLPSDSSDLDDDGDTAEPIPYDLQGFLRVVGAAVDLGAYEYPELNKALWLPAIMR